MPREECAATLLPFISPATSVIADARLAHISTQAKEKFGRLAACTGASERDKGSIEIRQWYDDWNERQASSVSK